MRIFPCHYVHMYISKNSSLSAATLHPSKHFMRLWPLPKLLFHSSQSKLPYSFSSPLQNLSFFQPFNLFTSSNIFVQAFPCFFSLLAISVHSSDDKLVNAGKFGCNSGDYLLLFLSLFLLTRI